jgi:cystathionine beta-lyase/cystathionine gamma-synthase
MRFETECVHAGLDPDPYTGAVVPPISQATTYVQSEPGQFVEDYDYSRAADPTRAALEKRSGFSRAGSASASHPGWRPNMR